MDIKPVEWLPIEQMQIGDKGLLVSNDNIVFAGELLKNDLVKIYEIDIDNSPQEENLIMHISEFKLFYIVTPKKIIH